MSPETAMTRTLLALVLLVVARQASADVAELFKAFRNTSGASATMHKPTEAIRVYATDDANTQICYVSGDVIYFYNLADDRITRPLYAKMFNVAAVNRITYRKSATGGAFLIWVDDTLELTFGS
jgi:hypothetical protein